MAKSFIDKCADINWFAKSGCPTNDFVLVPDAVQPFHDPKYQSHKVWRSQTEDLERRALAIVSSERIDEIFAVTARHLNGPVRSGLDEYFGRREERTESMKINADLGMWPEILDVVLRDLCWAHVEYVIKAPGFFHELLHVYKKGYWPCGWIGEFPGGRVAVL